MSKGKMTLMLISMLVVFVTSLSGCENSVETNAKKVNIALVLGNTANTARASTTDLEQYVMNVCYTYGCLSIIVPDGSPYAVEISVPEPEKDLSDSKLKSRAKQYCKQILADIEQIKAKTKEVDLLKAIQYGARSLASQDSGDNYLIVFHSGLSTTGSLDFTKEYLETIDIDGIVTQLKDASEIPSLENVHVLWSNMGDTLKPQNELSESNITKLKKIWETILHEAGAAEVEFLTDIPVNTAILDDLPYVTPVEVMKYINNENNDTPKPQKFDEYILSFKGNKAELLSDPAEFLSLAEDLTTYLRNNKEYKILLCGTTAKWGGKENCQKLSEDRAEKVKELILSTGGISEEQIVTIGLGYDNDFYEPDLDDEGNQIEELAKKNRAVIVLDYNSEEAKAILEKSK